MLYCIHCTLLYCKHCTLLYCIHCTCTVLQVSATPEVFKVNENLRSIDSITVPLDQEFAENSSTNNCSNEVCT